MSDQTVDPITFEVIRHRLWAINDDQARMAARLSGSPIVYEGYDFNVALLTGDGRGLFCGLYIMQHGATIDDFVRRVLHEWQLEQISEGDMFFTNDPWCGALHASDGILAMPIFADGRLVAWSGIVMHDADVGSPVPGSMAVSAPDRFSESPLFPPVKLVERFEVRRDVESIYLRNSRAPELNALNMRARIGALRTTNDRIQKLVSQYGVDALLATQERIVQHVGRVVGERLAEIPDGTWYAQGYLDNDGVSASVYVIKCALRNQSGRLTIDFTGTSPQAPGPINCTRPATEGSVFGVLLTFLCYDLPWAIGGLRGLVEIVSEEGTLNNARDPAAVSTASVSATLSTQDVVAHAFAKMLLCSRSYREEAQATWMPGFSGGFFTSVDRNGEHTLVVVSDVFAGGGGARTFADGIDSGGIMHSMASRMSNVEVIESRAPLLQVYRREMADAGGPGQYRGGAGVESAAIAHKARAPALYMTFASGVAMPGGRGLSGGLPGAAAYSVIVRGSSIRRQMTEGRMPTRRDEVDQGELEVLAAKAITALGDDDLLISLTASGSGYGDPLRRTPELVAVDVGEGLVSPEKAADVYGVVLCQGGIDQAATERLRQRLRERRRETHRRADASDGTVLHPVAETLEVIADDGTRKYRCTVCGHALGSCEEDYKAKAAMRELTLYDLSPANELCSPDYVVREYSCPGCGTAIAADVQHRSEAPLADLALGR